MLLRLPQIRVSRRCPQSAFPGGDGEARRSSRRRDPRRAYYLDRPCARHGAVLHPGERMALHGWLIIDKPVGPGSTQVVSAVKRALRDGGYPKVKVGHGGTLDPLASGVLPVALGEATKLCRSEEHTSELQSLMRISY